MAHLTADRIERFWQRVEKTAGCWIWQGSIGSVTGYGSLGNESAHRLSYEIHVGPIPEGMQIDHLCRIRACVNPDHLEVVTPRENYLRGVSLPAQNARKTHCLRGHEYTAENTGRASHGWRFCKTCIAARPKQQRQRASQAGQGLMWSYHKMPIEERRAYWRAAWRRKAQRRKAS
jgi:hypothetical protein